MCSRRLQEEMNDSAVEAEYLAWSGKGLTAVSRSKPSTMFLWGQVMLLLLA
jgi:hypothetical protein